MLQVGTDSTPDWNWMQQPQRITTSWGQSNSLPYRGECKNPLSFSFLFVLHHVILTFGSLHESSLSVLDVSLSRLSSDLLHSYRYVFFLQFLASFQMGITIVKMDINILKNQLNYSNNLYICFNILWMLSKHQCIPIHFNCWHASTMFKWILMFS